MSVLEDTGRGYPLPHPDNNPRSVDVPRLRQALELIDEDMTALASSLAGKADASGVTAEISAAISALLAGAPEAYDTLVEIADKLASDDDVIAGILTSIAAKANIVDVFTRNEMEGALDAKAPLNSPVFVNKVTLPNGRVIDETSLPFEALVRVQRSANTQLVRLDGGRMFDITSGTFTQTFAAAAVLGDGWWCYVSNSGTGDITIPASDGRTNWIMYPGEIRLFQCDGTVLRSIVIAPFNKTFTASGNFIKPPGYARFGGLLWAGGGGGNSTSDGGGGGGGACNSFAIGASAISDTQAFAIGAGGTVANNGGNSSFATVFAYGGSRAPVGTYGGGGGGLLGAAMDTQLGGAPADGSTKDSNFGGGVGDMAGGGMSVYGGGGGGNAAGNGGRSVFGGGGGARDGAGGTSTFGGNGGANGVAGSPRGGGGGRNAAGGRGELQIWGVA